jgi:hypothetical protein
MIALADLEGCTEEGVIEHLINYYSEKNSYDGTEYLAGIVINKRKNREKLKNMEILIAYEEKDSTDSIAYFLMKNKKNNQLYEIHACHCSCYGYEGQLELEETDIETLENKIKDKRYLFFTDSRTNNKIVNDFIKNYND